MIFNRDKKKETDNTGSHSKSVEDNALNRWRNLGASAKTNTSKEEQFIEDHGFKKRDSYLTSLMRDNSESHMSQSETDENEYLEDSYQVENDELDGEEYYDSDDESEFETNEEFEETLRRDEEIAEQEKAQQEFSQHIAIKLTQEFEEKDLFQKDEDETERTPNIHVEVTPPQTAPTKQKVLGADFGLHIDDDLANRFGSNLKSALGEGTMIDGTFSFETPVKVEGILSGEIKSQSALIVGKNARIHANIKVGSLIVLGEVEGDIVVEDLVEIRSSGSIHGNITTKRLALEEGGMLQGLCTMID